MLARACADAMLAADRATPGLGMTLESVAAGHAVITMPVRPDMLNGLGICHGGFIFSLADSAFAFACNSYGDQAVAQRCDIQFLRPAAIGETLRAAAVERTRSGRTGLFDVRVTGADGTIVAEFRGQSRTTGKRFFEPGDEPCPASKPAVPFRGSAKRVSADRECLP